jgi:quercetin dioxygenase-like cupin family protein
LFVLAGEIELACADESSVCGLHTFVGLPEGTEISLANRFGAKAGLLYLHTQEDARGGVLQGLGGVAITPLASAPSVYVADQKKNRTYFVSKEAARSERAHVMVVGYEKQTITPMHHHPNAESIFIMLSGSIRFSIDGDDVVLNPGQAAFFASNDRHALCCAEGVEAASFLEFHIPASFSTVK